MITAKRFAACLLMIVIPAFLNAQQFGGNPSSIKWMQINTQETRVIFPAGLDSQARRISNVNRLLSHTTAATIGGSQRKWTVVLLNQTTVSNAYVRMAPVMSELYMTPGQDNFSTGSIRWDDNLIIHENRHMQQLSNFKGGLTNVFSFFLGQEGQLLANGIVIPDYFFEGDAVWQETLVSAQGRGRMPNFYNGLKSLWLGNKNYSWMKLRSGSYKDYTPDHYELGYQLVAYGYQQFGDDFWKKVTTAAVHFKGLFYAYNKAIEKYSGVSYKQFRNDALQYFKERSLADTIKNKASLRYISPLQKNNVVDYSYPAFTSNDEIIVTKKSYKELSSFYLVKNGIEHKLRVKDATIDNYFSYRNGKVVYASYRPDRRWANKDFSVIDILDVKTNQQKQLTRRSKYFSPDINEAGTQILTASVNPDGSNNLQCLDAATGKVLKVLPNPNNYFYTQSKYLNDTFAISAVRNPEGKMCLVKVNLTNGESERITPFSFNVLGFPLIKGDTIYFSAMNKNADKVFAVLMASKKIFHLTNNTNGVYQPAVNDRGEMMVSAFSAEGYRLAKTNLYEINWQPANNSEKPNR